MSRSVFRPRASACVRTCERRNFAGGRRRKRDALQLKEQDSFGKRGRQLARDLYKGDFSWNPRAKLV